MIYIGNQRYKSPNKTLVSPDSYDAEIEWLGTAEESYTDINQGQYIDTGLYGTMDLDFEVKFMYTQLKTTQGVNEGTIFGGRTSYNQNGYQLTTYNKNTTSLGHFMYGNYQYSTANVPTLDLTPNTILTIKKEGRQFTKASGNTFTLSNPSFKTIYTIHIFNLNTSIPQEYTKYLKLYSLQFSRNGTILRDYIPVRVGQIGYLYDKVSGRLFGNQGTGNFTLGPDKI